MYWFREVTLASPERLLIREALVVTLDQNNTIHQSADVLVEDGEIVEVGQLQPADAQRCDRVIEAKDQLLVPGFVNAHYHSPANFIEGTCDSLSHPAFMWMNQAYTANKTPRETYVSAMLGCIQMLLSGTTASLDHFPGQICSQEDVDAVMSAHRDSGMRTVLGLRFFDSGFDDIIPRGGSIPGDIQDEMRRLNPLKPIAMDDLRRLMEDSIQRWHGAEGRLGVFPAPSNPERCSDEALIMCRDLAEQHDIGIHMHLLETSVQVDIAKEKYGCTMVEHLETLGLLSHRLSGAHTIWVNDSDIGRLAKNGSVVVHNPESNMKIGAGTAPIPEMVARGVTVALGTDGVGTNDNLILHEALRLAAMLHRPTQVSRKGWLKVEDVLRMATQGGAAALLQGERLGSIEAGKRADLVLYRLDAPWWVPVNDPQSQLVFAENGSSVDTVMVDGRILVEEGRITAFDAAAILSEAKPMMAAIRERNSRLHSLAQRMADLFP